MLGGENEIDVPGIKAVFKRAFEELDGVSGAKVGDKTMMDALIPASEAIAAYEGSDEHELFAIAARAAATAPRQAGSLFPGLEGPKATGPRPSEPPTPLSIHGVFLSRPGPGLNVTESIKNRRNLL